MSDTHREDREVYMRKLLFILIPACILMASCECMINEPYDHNHQAYRPLNLKTTAYFPFENNTNWWHYTETSGNQLEIKVIDTISDDNVCYYRVAFCEQKVDTTDDWFRRSSGSVMFGSSLTGNYNMLIPYIIDSADGSYLCGGGYIRYSLRDSIIINSKVFRNILILNFDVPMIHGFEQIILAESAGIVYMKDSDGRWPVSYIVDSCKINGLTRKY